MVAATVSTQSKRSWAQIVKGSATSEEAPLTSQLNTDPSEEPMANPASLKSTPIGKSWNVGADEFVPCFATTSTITMRAGAAEFVPAQCEDTVPEPGKSFVPIDANWIPSASWESNIVLAEPKEDSPPSSGKLNASAKEFTPFTHWLSQVALDAGLAECGQTTEGWQSVAQRMGKAFSLPAKRYNVGSFGSHMAGGDSSLLCLNPAFLADDESEDEDSGCNDSDKESNIDKSEIIEGDHVAIAELTCDIIGKVADVKGDTEPSLNESDKETSFNESVCSWQQDKDVGWSSDSDPRSSSAEDSNSLGSASDVDSEDTSHLAIRPPPGLELELPPWKVASRFQTMSDTADSMSSASESEGGSLHPSCVPPWKRPGSKVQEGAGGSHVVKIPPWRLPAKN